MGGICSKRSRSNDVAVYENGKDASKSNNSLFAVDVVTPSMLGDLVVEVMTAGGGGGGVNDGSGSKKKASKRVDDNGDDDKTIIVERPASGHHDQRRATLDSMVSNNNERKSAPMARIVSISRATEGEQIVAGWPSWLTSVAGEAIHGWIPRRANSFEKLDKIGQGTYSSVYKARDLETGKFVAMKKVRFVNMDPESVRFMAREIYILRKLDHPNVMKLECLVTSRVSCSLYLVFEYMDHDLSGLAATRNIKFNESQIKCYMKQLFSGLEHCHGRGILHRDIKGSNLLIDNNGVLKIGDFGLANFFRRHDRVHQPLTSRVVTLWYRPPELLFGATEYGVGVDLWSSGCIIAELFAGKPIMPGRTEVEQMHKIFKLCGSPSEEYWKRSKLPQSSSFKHQHRYKRCVVETFKDFPSSALALIDVLLTIEPADRGSASSALNSDFFSTKPLPCDPSSLPKYPPSKEFDARIRDEERRKRKAEAAKGRGPESVRRGLRDHNTGQSPEFNAHGKVSLQGQSTLGERHREVGRTSIAHSSSMVHPSAAGRSSWNKTGNEDHGKAFELRTQRSLKPGTVLDLSSSSRRRDESSNTHKEMTSNQGFVPKKNRMHYSGPLMPPGGNLDDMLKEHERQIQQAVRKARLDKTITTLKV